MFCHGAVFGCLLLAAGLSITDWLWWLLVLMVPLYGYLITRATDE
jgi:hypothetical protein